MLNFLKEKKTNKSQNKYVQTSGSCRGTRDASSSSHSSGKETIDEYIICMHATMHANICTQKSIHLCRHAYICMHIFCMPPCMQTCMYACLYAFESMYEQRVEIRCVHQLHACIYTCISSLKSSSSSSSSRE